MKNASKFLVSFLSLVMAAGSAWSAGPAPERETVIIDYFSRGREVPLPYAEMLRGGVIAGFMERGRHNLVDAERIPELAVNAMPGVIIDPSAIINMQRIAEERRAGIINSLGARYIVTGTVTSYKFKHENSRFSSTFVFTLISHDLKTGQSTSPEEFKVTGSGDSAEAADRKALESLPVKMLFYIDNHFKFQTEILRVEEPVKGKWKELYIHAGAAMGVRNGDLFKVYVESDIAGVPITKQIGKLRAKEVVGNDVTRCVISNGGQAIAEAFAERQKLIVVSDGQALF